MTNVQKQSQRRPATPKTTRLTPAEAAAALAGIEALAWHLAKRLRRANPSSDLDDLASAVRLGFVRAAQIFDPSRGVKFITFASRCGWQDGCRYLTQDAARGLGVPIGYQVERPGVLFQTDLCRTDGDLDPLYLIPDRPHSVMPRFPANFWARLTSCLAPREKQAILGVYRDGLSQTDLARRIGITRSAVQQFHAAALRKLRKRWGDDAQVLDLLP